MYDPLGSPSTSTGFGNVDSLPPWPTTPHTPNSPIPNLRPAVSPTPDRFSDDNPFEKQAQIYGQPEPGLISPAINTASNGSSFEKPEPYLKVRITGLDRNRRDILVRFDAQVRRHPILDDNLEAHLMFEYLKKKHRLICQTSLEQPTATCHDHMWSFNNSTMPLRTTTRRRSSLLSHWHKRPHRLTKKMIDWSKYCSSGGLLAYARI
jgi:hypothetical protein